MHFKILSIFLNKVSFFSDLFSHVLNVGAFSLTLALTPVFPSPLPNTRGHLFVAPFVLLSASSHLLLPILPQFLHPCFLSCPPLHHFWLSLQAEVQHVPLRIQVFMYTGWSMAWISYWKAWSWMWDSGRALFLQCPWALLWSQWHPLMSLNSWILDFIVKCNNSIPLVVRHIPKVH